VPSPPEAPAWPNTRLVIPAVGLRLVVQEGDDMDRLRDGPVHVPGTGAAGGHDRVVIAGHNNIHGSPFRDLDQLQEGDAVYLANGQGVWAYCVDTTAVLLPTDVDRIIDDTRRGLTLLTCYPYVHATQRLVVLASLVGRVDRLP
jgi:sortase A